MFLYHVMTAMLSLQPVTELEEMIDKKKGRELRLQ